MDALAAREGGAPVTRMGLIGDIHANDGLLARALADLARLAVDVVLATGDIVKGEGSVDRCCDLLRGARAIVVRGNHDRWHFERRGPDGVPPTGRLFTASTESFLRALPRTCTLDTAAGAAVLCHGIGEDDLAWLDLEATLAPTSERLLVELQRATGCRLMLSGHTHKFGVRRHGALTTVNAGTLAPADSPGWALLDLARRHAVWRALDSGGAAATAVTVPLPLDGAPRAG